ncbi:hypothetical protein G7B40_015185 [Aetokthonos hydrillicola Thurmond2011]|jgi:hypothetical protein|uniref:Uncharacterized protein n=1 Tax=Aetokthonos hydrillicola Thurmond2011 TaxID=2712845 RepID=A0AAP5M5H1_9CYAN|nr:hypothetical protein [Aetokthonos hydrillicola]MBW4586747.1 hypothetical protein [Aetokthonos hydrillicola CCALA 1050]MDR9895896.1 hypothetical protein [Aetokthonos hydrillicola Thurmond2011]
MQETLINGALCAIANAPYWRDSPTLLVMSEFRNAVSCCIRYLIRLAICYSVTTPYNKLEKV